MPKRITSLTDEQKAQMDGWADKWIAIGLCTERANRPKFEAAARECYRFANLAPPKEILWVDSPLQVALQAPVKAWQIANPKKKPTKAERTAAIQEGWSLYTGGQFWVSSGWWGGAFTSFFREVCDLELEGDLWDRARAYEATMESACWWWPHKDFIVVSERPTAIHTELVNPDRPRGWGSHRLHCDDGPAIAWPDQWGLWMIHGVRVTEQIVMHPETLTPDQITNETNVEVRRIMMDRYGLDRYVQAVDAKVVDNDPEVGVLREAPLPGDPDGKLLMVTVLDSTMLPTGERKRYTMRVHPELRPLLKTSTEPGGPEYGKPQKATARNAVASLYGMTGDEYRPAVET